MFRPLVTLCMLGSALPAYAQNAVATDEAKAAVMKGDEKDGWKVTGKVGATFNLNHNDSVVGTEDGLTLQLGGIIGLSAKLRDGRHGWTTTLDLQETQTKTPNLDRFVKSLDQLDLKTMYTYRFEDPEWLGIFARATLNTQIFEGSYLATERTDVYRVEFDQDPAAVDPTLPDVEASLSEGEAYTLTHSFEPLTLRQSAGVFAEPVKSTPFNLAVEVGLAGQEIVNSGGSVQATKTEGVADADGESRTVVVVRELESVVVELGAEAELDVRGKLLDEVLGYYLTVNAFFPPFTTSDVDRDFVDAINLKIKAGASAAVNDWLKVEYVLTMLRIPATSEELQIQNGLLLSAGFDII